MSTTTYKLGSVMIDQDTQLQALIQDADYLAGSYVRSQHTVEKTTREWVSVPSVEARNKTTTDAHSRGEDVTLSLVWLPTRSEWVGRVAGEVTVFESVMVGFETFPTDNAYTLPEAFGAVLTRAYDLRDAALTAREALRTSPEQLDALARSHPA
jgi:hypothetical protein